MGPLPLSFILGRLILRDSSAYIRVIDLFSLIPRDASVQIYCLCVKLSSKTHFRLSFALSCKERGMLHTAWGARALSCTHARILCDSSHLVPRQCIFSRL